MRGRYMKKVLINQYSSRSLRGGNGAFGDDIEHDQALRAGRKVVVRQCSSRILNAVRLTSMGTLL